MQHLQKTGGGGKGLQLAISTLPSNACATRINVPIVRFRDSFSIAEVFGALISFYGSGLTQIPPAIRGRREELQECAPRSFLSGTQRRTVCLERPTRVYQPHAPPGPPWGDGQVAACFPRFDRRSEPLRHDFPRRCIRTRCRTVPGQESSSARASQRATLLAAFWRSAFSSPRPAQSPLFRPRASPF